MASNPISSTGRKTALHRNPETESAIKCLRRVDNLQVDCTIKKKRVDMDGGPPEKRRRTETVDDWGDDEGDDFFFSQCATVLDHVEASQNKSGITEQNNNKNNSYQFSSFAGGYNKSGVNTRYPPLAAQKQTSSEVKSQGFSSMQPTLNQGNSSCNVIKSHSTAHLNNYKSQGSNNLPFKTVASTSGTRTVAPPRSLHANDSHLPNTKFTGVLQGKLSKTEEENRSLKIENKTLKDSQYSKDGQIKYLRTKVAQLEGERHKEKQNKILQKEKEQNEQSEKEKQLLKELEKVRTNLQFKEKDLKDLQERCKGLEKQCINKNQDANTVSPRRTQTAFASPERSPRVTSRSPNYPRSQRVDDSSPSTSKKSDFPTRRTFLGHEVSSKVVKPLHEEMQVTKVKEENNIEKKKKIATKMKLDINHKKGEISGPQVVSRLFDESCNTSEHHAASGSHPGIIGLLQNTVTLPTKEKESGQVILTPPRSTRSSGSSGNEIRDNKVAVASSKIKAAQQAISELLTPVCVDITGSIFKKSDFESSNTQQAVQIIPMLDNYLHLYIHFMETSNDYGSGSQSDNLTTATTTGSTTDSLTTSSGWIKPALASSASPYLLRLESQTLSALKVLDQLITYCKYMKVLISSGKEILMEVQEPSDTKPVITPNHLLNAKADELVTDVLNLSINDLDNNTIKVLKNCDIMAKLIKLANPLVFNNEAVNVNICIAALRQLAPLAAACSIENLKRFSKLFGNESLPNCFQDLDLGVEQQLVLSTCALTLINVLIKSPALLSQMCSQDDQCVLLNIYNTCLFTVENASQSSRLAYCHQLFLLLSNILRIHKHSPVQLFEGECRCCSMVVRCVTIAIHRELHENSNSPHVQAFLRSGLVTLYLISSKDRLFTRHHEKECKHEFLETVCVLNKLMPKIPDVSEFEMTLVYELWDFDQDQSSEDEINPDNYKAN